MSDANKLLMMFIKDSYKSANGKPTKKTAIALMKFVASDPELQGAVNNGDYTAILNYNPEPQQMVIISKAKYDILTDDKANFDRLTRGE